MRANRILADTNVESALESVSHHSRRLDHSRKNLFSFYPSVYARKCCVNCLTQCRRPSGHGFRFQPGARAIDQRPGPVAAEHAGRVRGVRRGRQRGGAVGTATRPPAPSAPPLPWKWTPIDPLEAGQRAYRLYFNPTRGGCGSGAYLSILSLLKERVGYPWTTLPDMLMSHAAAGYGGHGTLCGSLGGACCIINLVAYDDEHHTFRQMIDRLFYWYSNQEFPTDRFDDISSMPGQIKEKAMSPLCHTSVSKWARAAGEEITSEAKKERCAKVTGEVVYVVVTAINEYFAGRWTPPRWEPSDAIRHCIECHASGRHASHEAKPQSPAGAHGMPDVSHRSHPRGTHAAGTERYRSDRVFYASKIAIGRPKTCERSRSHTAHSSCWRLFSWPRV